MEYEHIQFTLDVGPDRDYRPLKDERAQPKVWEGEVLVNCSLTVTSCKEEMTLIHYFPGLALRESESAMLEDLEYYLDQEGLMDKILEVWEKMQDQPGPSWRKLD